MLSDSGSLASSAQKSADPISGREIGQSTMVEGWPVGSCHRLLWYWFWLCVLYALGLFPSSSSVCMCLGGFVSSSRRRAKERVGLSRRDRTASNPATTVGRSNEDLVREVRGSPERPPFIQ